MSNWECVCVHRKQGLFFSENVDDTKIAGKKAESGSHVEELHGKTLILMNKFSILDHVYVGCTQREC